MDVSRNHSIEQRIHVAGEHTQCDITYMKNRTPTPHSVSLRESLTCPKAQGKVGVIKEGVLGAVSVLTIFHLLSWK